MCNLCSGYGDEHCTTSDPYAGYDGAFRCLESGIGDIAFVRDNTVEQMLKNNSNAMSVSFQASHKEKECKNMHFFLSFLERK